jgi:hypothetical protein
LKNSMSIRQSQTKAIATGLLNRDIHTKNSNAQLRTPNDVEAGIHS